MHDVAVCLQLVGLVAVAAEDKVPNECHRADASGSSELCNRTFALLWCDHAACVRTNSAEDCVRDVAVGLQLIGLVAAAAEDTFTSGRHKANVARLRPCRPRSTSAAELCLGLERVQGGFKDVGQALAEWSHEDPFAGAHNHIF